MVPGEFSRHSLAAYEAARSEAAILERRDRGFIVVSGADRASYLHGLLTNDIATLKPGAGTYAAYLTPQGRMITDLWLYELGDVMLVAMPREVKDALLAKLDQFIFTEDVQLGDVSDTFGAAAIVGPRAAAVVGRLIEGLPVDVLQGMAEHGNARVSFGGEPAIVLRVTDTGAPGFDLLVASTKLEALLRAAEAEGAVPADAITADALRVEAGVPKFHHDMDEQTIPLEAGIEARAISMTKGCYVGQEVIVRVLHRGHGRVARKLVGLTLESGDPPAPGDAISADGHEVGRVTSGAMSPRLKRPIALGYVQRDYVEAGTRLAIGGLPAVVTALPFVPAGAS
jgi:folate-binding protein YgfZ